MTGHKNALEALALGNPVRAVEINLTAMENILNSIKAKAGENEFEGVKNALQQFVELTQFCGVISQIAQEQGKDTIMVNELVAEATAIHLEILALLYEKVPDYAKEAIERAMEVSVKGHERALEALEEAGALGSIPDELPIPEDVQDKIENKSRRGNS